MPSENPATGSETTMLGDTLRQLHESGELPAPVLADLVGLHPSSIYRWFADTDPGFMRVRQIFRQCGSAEAQRALLALLITGTGWVATLVDGETDCDVNGDGRVCGDDAVAAGVQLVARAAEALREVHATAELQQSRGENISGRDRQAMMAMLDHVLADALRTQRILKIIDDQASRRRKARPVTVGGE